MCRPVPMGHRAFLRAACPNVAAHQFFCVRGRKRWSGTRASRRWIRGADCVVATDAHASMAGAEVDLARLGKAPL
eukprot:2848970-Prymnesium_polylepis.1